ncbi:MAG: hypothetical protein QNK20_01105 [Aureibaculum sp.]|nr:hypothetical protein [Aureibaculum sp.]
MDYNKKSIKHFKGRIIEIGFKPKKINFTNKLTGEITATTDSHLLFKVNKAQPEIILNYLQIISINEPEKQTNHEKK